MPALNNQRHERFCQALVEGRSASAAYVEAGFRGNSANAARLKATEAIKRRITELTEAAAKAHEISIEGILAELEAAIKLAKDRGMPNALINAANLRAKLGGLLIDRAQVEINGNSDKFEDCRDFDEVCRTLADSQIDSLVNARWRLITESDRNYLAGIFQQAFSEAQAFLDSIEARPSHSPEKPIITIAASPK